ncbi:hypothetical protein GTZ99_10750 [Novosphingobium sp. FSY-8]|uniref:Tetratricopeptide repeat protein n=1 Tax=Novosphingobium ovatum TaxID=1908523 RepID=A0ABW9XER9_9SPHN|nr:hypothetical protein [Novosphingobium ovatum]NBC37034.1 hypothetical protein [Novosphingobium ovatum]
MSFALMLLPVLLQYGPSIGDAAPVRLPQIDRPTGPNRRGPLIIQDSGTVQPTTPQPPSPLKICLDAAAQDPDAGERAARAWVERAKSQEASVKAQAQLCLGTALAAQEEFEAARTAFVAGLDMAGADDRMMRAQLGAMAGNAALAAGDAVGALMLLDTARAQAMATGRSELTGGIAIDRARALVALKRLPDAAMALTDARTIAPNEAQGWLLSATLSRRMDKLADAQAQIQTAATLAPRDPDVGLEAGVIAMLSGREAAARKSWESVIASAPASDAAKRAAAYLAQLPATQPTVTTASPAPTGK